MILKNTVKAVNIITNTWWTGIYLTTFLGQPCTGIPLSRNLANAAFSFLVRQKALSQNTTGRTPTPSPRNPPT